MLRHLGTCEERKAAWLADEEGVGYKKCGCFELVITAKYRKAYWLIIEMPETATLKDLDNFLRDIWLECCGHLSAFNINGISYECEVSDCFWGRPAKNNPPEILCDESDEFMQFPVCNSPRMGVCGYEGSSIYLDQFEPDEKKNII